MTKAVAVLLVCLTASLSAAFAPAPSLTRPAPASLVPRFMSEEETAVEDDALAGRNPDRPELPEIKGDYDWDAKFGGDDDWITENVPGKIVLNEVQLAGQVTALSKLEDKWKQERLQKEYEEARILGWTGQAETYNGRFAMFFLVVGLLTEYWTGISIPGQIEEMLRVGGFIGPDY